MASDFLRSFFFRAFFFFFKGSNFSQREPTMLCPHSSKPLSEDNKLSTMYSPHRRAVLSNFLKIFIIYLAVPGLSCGWPAASLAAAGKLSVVARGI